MPKPNRQVATNADPQRHEQGGELGSIRQLANASKHTRLGHREILATPIVGRLFTRSPAGAGALVKIAAAVYLHGSDDQHDNKWLEEVVNDDLSFWKLRLDLLVLCRKFELPDGMFTTPDAWHRFSLPLAFEVSGRRVSISADQGGRIRDARCRLAQSVLDKAHRPMSLRIIGDTQHKWWWEIQTPAAPIQVQVLFGSFRGADFPVPHGWASPLASQGDSQR
jgi:hypothetical protein